MTHHESPGWGKCPSLSLQLNMPMCLAYPAHSVGHPNAKQLCRPIEQTGGCALRNWVSQLRGQFKANWQIAGHKESTELYGANFG